MTAAVRPAVTVVPVSAGRPFSKTHYSTAKFLALNSYCRAASRWRVAGVLLLTPLPALIGSILPSLVPLNDPRLGHDRNISTQFHGCLLVFLGSFGAILLVQGATQTPRSMYSELEGLVIAASIMPMVFGFSYALCHYWMFPSPFSMFSSSVPWGVGLFVSHRLLLHYKFKRYPKLAHSLARHAIPLTIQSSQLYVYAAFTVLFDRLSSTYQLVMVAAFPLVKYVFKKVMLRYSVSLNEMSSEVAISAVEICASLYQSMIMQTTPSTTTMAVIMVIDFIQAMISIRYFVGRHLRTPRREVFHTALEVLETTRADVTDLRKMSVVQAKLKESSALVVREALELATEIDAVLIIEYFEVSVPIVNALFLLATYCSSSTKYNTRLYAFYENTSLVLSSTQSVVLYSLLQGTSLVVMHFVLKWRHNISAVHHLAFVLEYHVRSIHGKLVMFLPLVFYFTLVHYGTCMLHSHVLISITDIALHPPPFDAGADFTLKFDVNATMAKIESSLLNQ